MSSAEAFANGCSVLSTDNSTSIYFSNGILTEPLAADFTVIDLKNAYKSSLEFLDSSSTYDFFKAYNETQGALTDITQVLQQKQNELGIVDDGLSAYQVYQWVQSRLSVDEVRALIAVSVGIVNKSALAAAITEESLESLSNTMLEASSDALLERKNVNASHVGFYEADLLAGKRVIIVAHSQGNLFTNQAISDVIQRNPDLATSIAAIGVASPAEFTVANNIYITAHDDRVIDGLRLISNVLPSNVDNDPGIFNDFRSNTNHYFGQDYFDSRLSSRDEIDKEINKLAQNLPYPEVIAGDGAIRASLTWGGQPDVDLHAYEPSGDHVYYSNKVGSSGFLDVDDTRSYGPENYFVACEDVVVGTYSIGVNYFSGTGSETAEIALFLGDGRTITPRTQVLTQSLGFSGDNSPILVFEIDVAENGNGQIIYTVR